MSLQRRIFSQLYRRAPDAESLAWHRNDPHPLLERAIASRPTPGRALDVGCGEGVNATYLAQQGFSVVGLDFVPAALTMARARAERAHADVEFHECDVVDYEATSPFDLVVDSGCLHHMPKTKLHAYRARLDEWLAPGGDFVLVHFIHRPMVGWIPKGPRHMSHDDAVEFCAPLELEAGDETSFDVPFPMGTMRAGVYWFKRPAS
jgi:2-polyprenyl-3-methyl-5-hydroxy-6-metoxy-1,4-benzoquinol methylase